jgi:predicted ATP-dependent Lon-type protease
MQDAKMTDRFDRISKIARQVANKSRKSSGWVAEQVERGQSVNDSNGIAFIVGKEAAYFSNEDMDTLSDDELIVKAFVEVNGYEPDSAQDIEAHIAELELQVETIDNEMAILDQRKRDRMWHIGVERERLEKLKASRHAE